MGCRAPEPVRHRLVHLLGAGVDGCRSLRILCLGPSLHRAMGWFRGHCRSPCSCCRAGQEAGSGKVGSRRGSTTRRRPCRPCRPAPRYTLLHDRLAVFRELDQLVAMVPDGRHVGPRARRRSRDLRVTRPTRSAANEPRRRSGRTRDEDAIGCHRWTSDVLNGRARYADSRATWSSPTATAWTRWAVSTLHRRSVYGNRRERSPRRPCSSARVYPSRN